MDSGLVDEIGNTADDPVKVSTRGNELDQYKLVESGADTGIFIGEVTLQGLPMMQMAMVQMISMLPQVP